MSVNIPDSIYDDLERWADSEGTKPASHAAFLLERVVREARERGEIPSKRAMELRNYKTLSQLVLHFMSKLVESGKFPSGRLEELVSGSPPTEVECLRIALLCGVSEEFVSQLVSDIE